MSPAEVAWRLGRRARLQAWAGRAGRPVPALMRATAGGFRAAYRAASAALEPDTDTGAFAAALERDFPGETDRVVARAEAILAGRIELFDRGYDFGPDPLRWPWNRSPDGGPEAPLVFGPTLDYRDPARVGDARLAWELGRHGFLVPVAQAAYLTSDPRYARFVFTALEAWIAACPPYQGLQWASALEFALRSFSWGYALALVAHAPGGETIDEARWERVLATWAEQLRFVAAHDARFSSANNHRLGEAAGLAWGGRLLAFLPEAGRWREQGLAILEASLLEQTTPDGVTREHAFQYQHFVLDFAVLVEALEIRNGRATPERIAERVARVTETLEAFSPGGVTWTVGDGDEGQVLPTGEPFETRTGASLECAARLIGAPWRGREHPRARWLGFAASAEGGASDAEGGVSDARVAGGYLVARRNTARGEARLLFDSAELGLPPLHAHGHADALMVLLDVAGPRLVDPGTGGYHAHAALRERLRATSAHNTVEVDGVSQSVPGGLFQWLQAARILEPVTGDLAGGWTAAHDGYRRLEGGVTHRRQLRWATAERIEIEDALEGAGLHRAVTRWHLGDGRATPGAGEPLAYEARWPDGFALTLVAELPPGSTLRAGEDAVWSPRFLAPRPCGVVEWIVEGRLPLSWRTTILLHEGGSARGSA